MYHSSERTPLDEGTKEKTIGKVPECRMRGPIFYF
jgi:hypothetical protein